MKKAFEIATDLSLSLDDPLEIKMVERLAEKLGETGEMVLDQNNQLTQVQPLFFLIFARL